MVHLAVASLGAFVILLQRIYSCKEGLQIRTIKPGQSWEQALFFVGGVFGSRLTKIAQARRQSSLLLVGEGTALRAGGDRQQCIEKAFYAAVTVSEHSDRIREITFALCTNHNWHSSPPVRCSDLFV